VSYDTKCYELAVQFLTDEGWTTDKDIDVLAQCIQDAIEDWITGRAAEEKP